MFTSSWNGRIPFVLLFGIATSVELFQDKMPRNTIRRLRGKEFKLEQVDFDEIFEAIHSGGFGVWLGPELSRMILQQHRDHFQSNHQVTQRLKVR